MSATFPVPSRLISRLEDMLYDLQDLQEDARTLLTHADASDDAMKHTSDAIDGLASAVVWLKEHHA